MSIYVDIVVRAPIDAVWAHTQTPALHEQWDLRFSAIDYLPRSDDSAPQRFRYATRIGFGLEVAGEGETVGQRDLPDGSATSALKFASEAPLSIIRDGSGYWKYIPTREGVMTSIYQRVLGADFNRLHPQLQRRFGFSSSDGLASIGTGVMDEIWKGRLYTEPFLYVGSWRRIMFPDTGRKIPFTIENYAFVDQFGRETVSWIRTFQSHRRRRFDAYMVYSETRGRIVDYLGSHEHLAVDIDLSVDDEGGLRLRSGAQRFYEGAIGFSFPMLFSGIADVREWYDDAAGCFRIVVDVRNSVWGRLFGYRGRFDVEWRRTTLHDIPEHIRPQRQERRE